MAFIDHLEIVTPDYTDTILTKSANFDIPMPGAYKQVVNETDGGSRKVVTMKTTPDATVNLKFTGVTQAEADTLSDLYYNPLKAYGMARSYIWQHSQTQEFFTLQNISEYNETATIMSYGRYDISFTAKILGVPGLTIETSGATVDFQYEGTTVFTTKYQDGTDSVLTNPPAKDFGSELSRLTLILADNPILVTGFFFSFATATNISNIKSYIYLEKLWLDSTQISEPPNVDNNIHLTWLYLSNSNLTEAPALVNNTALTRLYLHKCNISIESLSICVDQLYVNRVAIGGNACDIRVYDNNGLTADAIAKIDGTGIYAGDGLIDNGCTVTY